jgi:hypothetical protein
MKTQKELKLASIEFLKELKSEGVEPKRYAFELSLYLKSLASIERSSIAITMAADRALIASIVDEFNKK